MMKSNSIILTTLGFLLAVALTPALISAQPQIRVVYDDGRAPEQVSVFTLPSDPGIRFLRANDVARLFRATQFWNASTRKVVLGKTDGLRWHGLALVDHPVDAGQWYTLRVEAIGDRLRVFVDGEMKIDVRDSDYAKGMVGVRVVDTHACFDDFQITPK